MDKKEILRQTLKERFDSIVEKALEVIDLEKVGIIDIMILAMHDIGGDIDNAEFRNDLVGKEIVPDMKCEEWADEDDYHSVTLYNADVTHSTVIKDWEGNVVHTKAFHSTGVSVNIDR